MVYTVEKLGPGRWEIRRPAVSVRVGIVASRKEAMAIARLLAGWRGTVEKIKGSAS